MSDTLFITGATSGFGEACARRFAEAGWKLVLTGRRAERLNALVEELSKQTEVHGLVVDVRDRKGMEEAIANLPPSFATLRGLINNAGLFSANPLDSSDIGWLDGWEDTLRINLTAAAELSRFAVKHWLDDARAGRIVHIASRAGYRGDSPDHWHYAAAKGGMLAMHKTIARQYAAQGILSFAVTPGFTDTAMAGDYLASRTAMLADPRGEFDLTAVSAPAMADRFTPVASESPALGWPAKSPTNSPRATRRSRASLPACSALPAEPVRFPQTTTTLGSATSPSTSWSKTTSRPPAA